MNKIVIFWLCCSLFFVYGCAAMQTVESTDIRNDQICQVYQIEASKNETTAYAYFALDGAWGNAVDLDEPSRISLNNQKMRENKLFYGGTNYSQTFNEFVAAHEFEFTDADGKVYRNRIEFEQVEFQLAEPLVIKRGQTNFVPLTRLPANNENARFDLSHESINNPPQQFGISPPATFDNARRALVIAPETLKNAAIGDAVLKMRVSKDQALEQQTKAGGGITIMYQAADLKVRIVD